MSSFEVRLRAFLAHYDELSQTLDKEDGFLKEFIALKLQSQSYKEHNTYPADSGQLPCNRKKNRFKDILPFEYTRVSLHPVEGVEGSDYINANYITGSGDVPYIAAQGPLLHTVKDFWRMLWYHNIEAVVMACREVEMAKPKCQVYWPALHQELVLGAIRVTTTHEENISNDFVIRDLKAECDGQQQHIRQYHYMSWPDHGKPTSAEPIIRMTEMIDRYRKRRDVPLVVHCSAGCGRTGTILAIDICRTMLVSKALPEDFSVYKVVEQMRQQRPAMVQAKEQYHFVYMAAAELSKRALGMKPHVPAKPNHSSKKNAKYYQNVEVDSTDGKQPTETESEAIYQNTEAVAPPSHARPKISPEDPANDPPPVAPPRTGARYENVQLRPEITVGGANSSLAPPTKDRPPVARKRSGKNHEKPDNAPAPAPAPAPKPRPRSKPESPALSRTPSPPDHTHKPLPEVPPTEENRQPSPRPSLPYAPTSEPVVNEAIYSSVDMAALRDMGPEIQLVDESSGRRAELTKVEKKLEKNFEQFKEEDMSPTKKSSILDTILAEVGDILPEESKPSLPLPPLPNPQKFAANDERLPFTSEFPDEVPPEIPRRTEASQELMDDDAPRRCSVTITKSASGGDINSLYESPTPLSIPMTNTVDDNADRAQLFSGSTPNTLSPSGGVGSGTGSHSISTVPRNFTPSQTHSPSKTGGIFGKLRKKTEKKKMTIGDISGPITSAMVKSNSEQGLQPGVVVGGAGGQAGDTSNLDRGPRLPLSPSPQHEQANERYKFPGDMGYGIRIGKPRGPRPEPPSWKSVPNNVV